MVQAVSNLIEDNDSDIEEFVCAICRDDFSDFETRCRHYFHKKCLYRWLNGRSYPYENDLCPYCRTPISVSPVVERFFRNGSKVKFSLEFLNFTTSNFISIIQEDLSDKKLPLKKLVKCFIIKNSWNINEPFDIGYGYNFIHLAAKSGHLNLLEFLLSKGAEIDAKTCDGKTALHIAVEQNHLEIVKALVLAGADINAQDSNLDTPLHLAAIKSDIEIVKVLLENGANLSVKNKNQSALENLIEFKYTSDVKFFKTFFENEKTENLDVYLFIACKTKNIEIVKFLIERGANVKYKDANGYTSLHNAAAKGSPEIINLLLDKGADIEAKDFENLETPIFSSCRRSNLNNIKALIDRGANLHIKSKDDMTVFQAACISSDSEAIEFFFNLEPDIFIRTRYQQEMFTTLIQSTPHLFERIKGKLLESGKNDISILHAICNSDDYDLLMEFIEKGFDVNALDFEGETPFFSAYDERIINELINRSADIYFKGSNGMTPFLKACYYGNAELFKYFIDSEKVDLQQVCNAKRNALHYSTISGELDFVKTLLRKGVKYDQIDVYGHYPVYYTIFDKECKFKYGVDICSFYNDRANLIDAFFTGFATFEELKGDDDANYPIIRYYKSIYREWYDLISTYDE